MSKISFLEKKKTRFFICCFASSQLFPVEEIVREDIVWKWFHMFKQINILAHVPWRFAWKNTLRNNPHYFIVQKWWSKLKCTFNAVIHQVALLKNAKRLHYSCLPVLPVSLLCFPIMSPVQAMRLMWEWGHSFIQPWGRSVRAAQAGAASLFFCFLVVANEASNFFFPLFF